MSNLTDALGSGATVCSSNCGDSVVKKKCFPTKEKHSQTAWGFAAYALKYGTEHLEFPADRGPRAAHTVQHCLPSTHRVLGGGRPRDMSCVLIRDLQRVPDVAQPLSERHYWDGDGQQ